MIWQLLLCFINTYICFVTEDYGIKTITLFITIILGLAVVNKYTKDSVCK